MKVGCGCGATDTFTMDGDGIRGRYCSGCKQLIRREPKPVIVLEEDEEDE